MIKRKRTKGSNQQEEIEKFGCFQMLGIPFPAPCVTSNRCGYIAKSHAFFQRKATTKGGFFSESSIHFLDLQISKKNIPKNYPELEI